MIRPGVLRLTSPPRDTTVLTSRSASWLADQAVEAMPMSPVAWALRPSDRRRVLSSV